MKENQYYTPIGTKNIKCIDCGKEVFVVSSDTRTCRCDDCRVKHGNNKRMKSYYKSKFNDGYIIKHDDDYFLFKDNISNYISDGYYISEIIYPDEESRQYRYPYQASVTKDGYNTMLLPSIKITNNFM